MDYLERLYESPAITDVKYQISREAVATPVAEAEVQAEATPMTSDETVHAILDELIDSVTHDENEEEIGGVGDVGDVGNSSDKLVAAISAELGGEEMELKASTDANSECDDSREEGTVIVAVGPHRPIQPRHPNLVRLFAVYQVFTKMQQC